MAPGPPSLRAQDTYKDTWFAGGGGAPRFDPAPPPGGLLGHLGGLLGTLGNNFCGLLEVQSDALDSLGFRSDFWIGCCMFSKDF